MQVIEPSGQGCTITIVRRGEGGLSGKICLFFTTSRVQSFSIFLFHVGFPRFFLPDLGHTLPPPSHF